METLASMDTVLVGVLKDQRDEVKGRYERECSLLTLKVPVTTASSGADPGS